jgi:hypothetical protein
MKGDFKEKSRSIGISSKNGAFRFLKPVFSEEINVSNMALIGVSEIFRMQKRENRRNGFLFFVLFLT